MKWILLGLALWNGPTAVGELQSARPGGEGKLYHLATHVLRFTVRHPFRVVRFESDGFHGQMRLVPGDFTHGLALKMKAPVKSLLEGFSKGDRKELNQFFESEGLNGPMEVGVKGIDALRMPKGAEGPAEMDLHATVEVGGRQFSVPLALNCEPDGHVVRCRVNGRAKLSDIVKKVPVKWGLPMEDSVYVSGDLSFSPKE